MITGMFRVKNEERGWRLLSSAWRGYLAKSPEGLFIIVHFPTATEFHVWRALV